MNYGSATDGEKYLRLTSEEVKQFESGKPIVRRSADSKGWFKITVKMTRPKTKAARFRGL